MEGKSDLVKYMQRMDFSHSIDSNSLKNMSFAEFHRFYDCYKYNNVYQIRKLSDEKLCESVRTFTPFLKTNPKTIQDQAYNAKFNLIKFKPFTSMSDLFPEDEPTPESIIESWQ